MKILQRNGEIPGLVRVEGRVNLGKRLRFCGELETRSNQFCFEQPGLIYMVLIC